MQNIQEFHVVPAQTEKCAACGKFIESEGGYVIPRLAGIHCTLSCVEAHLFGLDRCRWCGDEILKPYTTVDSRLCSEDCSEAYYAHVAPLKSDRTAKLGTGKRLGSWLQASVAQRKVAKIAA